MKKKKDVAVNAEAPKEPKKGIVISETEEDVVLGGGLTGDPEDFKNEVKKEAEKGKFVRVMMPIFVFLLLGALIGYVTWYYQNQSEKETPKKLEEKIQTPPAVDDATTIEVPTTDTTTTTPDATTTPDTSVSSEPATGYTTYVVKSGDTLSGIANAHDMTSSALAKYNGLTDAESLQIGQKLKIPN